jgi:hypothetical protein
MHQSFIRVHVNSTLILAVALMGCASAGGEEGNTGSAAMPGPAAMPAASGGDPAATGTPEPTPVLTGVPQLPAGDPSGSLVGDGTEEIDLDHQEVTAEDSCGGLELVPEEIVVEIPKEITTTMEVLKPLAFYIVLDNSLSMNDPLPGFENGNGGGQFPMGGNDDDDDMMVDPAEEPMMAQLAGEAGAGGGAAVPTGAGGAAAPAAGAGGAAEPAGPVVVPTQTVADARTRWELAVASIQEFVTSPASAGVDVAIQYFNPPGQGGGGLADADSDVCTGAFHSVPDVEMGRLPDNAQALVDSLDQMNTDGYTPTVGALTGGVQYCEQFQAANPEEKCVVVLVTDGLPRGCGLNSESMVDPLSEGMLVPIAQAGAAAGVRTFAVVMDGVPADGFALLDAVAAAGGTDCTPPDVGAEACNVSSSGSQGLVETLIAIRESETITETVTEIETVIEHETLECQWLIPTPPAEQGALNPDRVNVDVAFDGVTPERIVSVENEAACATNGGLGWYYDNPAAPTQIFACPGTCEAIQGAETPSIEILLGCVREVPEVMK